MKILCVIDTLSSGGAQRQMVSLAIHFSRCGHEVSFLTYYPGDFFHGLLLQEGIPCTFLNEPRPLQKILKVRQFIRNGSQDIVLSFLDGPNLLCELSGLPWRRWGLIVGERSANLALFKNFKTRFLRLLHHCADFVVANSRSNQEMLEAVRPGLKNKIMVIYNMVDLQKFSPVQTNPSRRTEKIRLVIAANHTHVKNLCGLARAISLLSPEEQAQLCIEWYGNKESEPPPYQSYMNAVAAINAESVGHVIKLSPAVSHIEKKIQGADAIGLFSFFEGLPNAVCEGMACEKPIVGSHVSDMKHLVTEGVNGFLCDPCSAESMAAALRKLLACTPAQLSEMGKVSRQKAEELFSPEKTGDRYLSLMQKALAKKRPG